MIESKITTNQIIELAHEALRGKRESLLILNDVFEDNELPRISDEDWELLLFHKKYIKDLKTELLEVEKAAETGYAEAWELIRSLQDRLEKQESDRPYMDNG